MALLPEHLERVTWSAERLRSERQARLRDLLRVAKERSAWHRRRLAHVDVERVCEEDLASIPPMSKADLMDNFDAIITDRRLSHGLVDAHLSRLDRDAYLLDQYHASLPAVRPGRVAFLSSTGRVGLCAGFRSCGFGSGRSAPCRSGRRRCGQV
jgi:hypothetical protein